MTYYPTLVGDRFINQSRKGKIFEVKCFIFRGRQLFNIGIYESIKHSAYPGEFIVRTDDGIFRLKSCVKVEP